MCRGSTFKHQSYCRVTRTLQHRGKADVESFETKKRGGDEPRRQTSKPVCVCVTVGSRNPGTKRGLVWATFIPPAVRVNPTHAWPRAGVASPSPVHSCFGLSLSVAGRPPGRAQRQWSDSVIQCSWAYSTVDRRYVGRLHVRYSKWALHSTTVRESWGGGRGWCCFPSATPGIEFPESLVCQDGGTVNTRNGPWNRVPKLRSRSGVEGHSSRVSIKSLHHSGARRWFIES